MTIQSDEKDIKIIELEYRIQILTNQRDSWYETLCASQVQCAAAVAQAHELSQKLLQLEIEHKSDRLSNLQQIIQVNGAKVKELFEDKDRNLWIKVSKENP